MRVTFNLGITGCTDYDVHIIKGSECFLYPCEIDDSGNVTVELIPGCETDLCIEGTIICNDGCESCTKDFRKCLCTELGECTEPCTECIDGLCEPICPDQLCDNDKCVDCITDDDCTGGRECRNGKCECPVNKPYVHPTTGECAACVPGEIVDCYICNDGFWEPVECGDGVCDPETDTCVDCINSGDCGPNQVCEDNDCVCAPGYVWNPVTETCDPAPPCVFDSDCGDCEICGPDGECIPLECPEDYVCENGECVYNPCPDTPCENGTDCGDGCGCGDDGFCHPCVNLDCDTDECAKTLGCECQGSTCVEVKDCDTPCTTGIDCPEGCGCDDGICKDCSNYDCTDCLDIDGCACINGKCEDFDNPCKDELTTEVVNCTLEGELTKEASCACPALTGTGEVTKAAYDATNLTNTVDFKVTLRKGTASSMLAANMLPLLGDTTKANIYENDTPLSGTVQLTISPVYKELRADGKFYTIIGPEDKSTSSIVDKDTVTFTDISVPQPGDEVETNYFVDYVDIEYSFIGNLEFDNTCEYTQVVIGKVRLDQTTLFTGDLSNFDAVKVITTDGSRDPVFRWFKSTAVEFSDSDIFRKGYIGKVGTSFKDILYGPAENTEFNISPDQGEIWAGYNYQLQSDCTCDPIASIENLQVCDTKFVENTHFELDECNTVFKGKASEEPCAINKDLDQYETTTYTIPDAAQTYYDLYINGTKVESFKYSDTLSEFVAESDGTSFSNFTYDAGQAITKIVWGQNHGTACDITLTYEEEDFDVDYTLDCGGKTTYLLLIGKVQGVNEITDIIIGKNTLGFEEAATEFRVQVKRGVEASFQVVFSSGCTKTITASEDCCADFAFNPSVENLCNQEPTISLTTSGTTPASYFDIYYNGNLIEANYTGTSYTVSSGNYGSYTITAFPCEVSKDLTVNESDVIDLVVTGAGAYCGVDEASITFSFVDGNGSASTVTDVATIEIEKVTGTGLTTETGLVIGNSYTISGVEVSTAFTVKTLTLFGGDCEITFDEKTYNIDFSGAPVVDSITLSQSTVCQGSDVIVTVNGTPGADVAITGIGTVTLDALGEANYTHTAAVTTTFAATSVSIGEECPGDVQGSQATLTVNSLPTFSTISSTCNATFDGKTITWTGSNLDVDLVEPAAAGITSPYTVTPLSSIPSNGELEFDLTDSVTGCTNTYTLQVGTTCDCTDNIVATLGATSGTLTSTGTNAYTLETVVGTSSNVTVTPTTGTAPYDYLWNDPLGTTTNMITVPADTARTYTVDITDTYGCTGTVTLTVITANCADLDFDYTVNGVLNPTEIDIVTASGIDIVITASGGGTTYEYFFDGISNGATNNQSYPASPAFTNPADEFGNIFTLKVTDDRGCSLTKTFVYNEIDCTNVNATITDVDVRSDYDGGDCCALLWSITLDERYAQYVDSIDVTVGASTTTYTNGPNFHIDGNQIIFDDVFPVCASGAGDPADFDIEMLLQVREDSCVTPTYLVVTAECDCIAPEVTDVSLADNYGNTYAPSLVPYNNYAPFCDNYPSMQVMSISGLAENATVTMVITDALTGTHNGLTGYSAATNTWNIAYPVGVTCTQSVSIKIDAEQCGETFEWTFNSACDWLAVDANSTNISTLASCAQPLVALASGGSGFYSYQWTITHTGGPTVVAGASVDPTNYLNPGETGTFAVEVTDTHCGNTANDSVSYTEQLSCDFQNQWDEPFFNNQVSVLSYRRTGRAASVDTVEIKISPTIQYQAGDLADAITVANSYGVPIEITLAGATNDGTTPINGAVYVVDSGGITVSSDDGSTIVINIDYSTTLTWPATYVCCQTQLQTELNLTSWTSAELIDESADFVLGTTEVTTANSWLITMRPTEVCCDTAP